MLDDFGLRQVFEERALVAESKWTKTEVFGPKNRQTLVVFNSGGIGHKRFPRRLTRQKISDREPSVACDAVETWMANPQKVHRSLARGSLHRLVRR